MSSGLAADKTPKSEALRAFAVTDVCHDFRVYHVLPAFQKEGAMYLERRKLVRLKEEASFCRTGSMSRFLVAL